MIRLSDELESYNKAQEALDKQNNSKIMDLKSKEEKIARLVAEVNNQKARREFILKNNPQ